MSANGLRPYPAYRDSGVEWLGRVPEHWEVRRLGATTERLVAGTWGSDPTGHDDIVCVRVADFDRRRLGVNLRKPTLRSVPVGERQRRLLEPGDLLLEKSGGGDLQPVGVVVHFDHGQEAVASNFIGRMRVRRQHSARYVLYLNSVLYAIRLTVRSIKQTTGIQNLDVGAYLSESVPLPSLSEQTSIARFLEAADRRIRRYIRAKERLVELLEERKRALIHEAVTGRIDVRTGQPYPTYKDSGVEWLGKVPEHWEVRRVKTEFHCLNRRRIPLSGTQRGAMKRREYDYYGASGVIDKVDDYLFDDTLLLIAEDGANLVLRNLPLAIIARGKFWVNNHAHILKPKRSHIEFLGSVMENLSYLPWISGAAQPKLTQDRLMSIAIAVPPRLEQDQIVDSLAATTLAITSATKDTERQIALLREYRTRLIADVVTGKLDVREAAADLPATDPLAGDRERADPIPTESNLHSTAQDMMKEASA